MKVLRQYRHSIYFLASLVLCTAMVQWQFQHNEAKHIRLREDLIFKETRGLLPEAQCNYERLVSDIPHLPNSALIDDLYRTGIAAARYSQDAERPSCKYYCTVRNELRKRSVKGFVESRDLVKNIRTHL